jgi:citrate synthase
VRGHTINELVAHHGYEGAIAILWEGFAGDNLTRAEINKQLGAARRAAFSRIGEWLPAAVRRPVTDGVRMCLAALQADSSPATIVASLPVAVSALVRARLGQALMQPDPQLSMAADFMRMVNGAAVEERYVDALETYWTTVIDNGLSASTFAGRVIISTRASLLSAVIGAYGAFTGPLHGGAPELALDMLEEIE